MNIQKHSNLFYRINSYEVFFDRKYSHRLNNFATITEQQSINTNNFCDNVIDRHCAQEISNPAIKNAFIKHLKKESEGEKNDDKNVNDENKCKYFV